MKRKENFVIISTHKKGKLYFAAAFSQKGKIIRISLPTTNKEEVVTELSDHHPEFILDKKYEDIVAIIAQMYFGKISDFNMELLEMDISKESSHETSSMKTNFERDVILEVAATPPGCVKTYKDIGKSLDTRGYRAVGTAVGKNPFPIVVPCHRVLRSDGTIGGFRGGKQMKIDMLINEGFNIRSNQVILEK